eukprot:scaffold3739_cov207-Isochrysis_galbana.AAC.2
MVPPCFVRRPRARLVDNPSFLGLRKKLAAACNLQIPMASETRKSRFTVYSAEVKTPITYSPKHNGFSV